MEAYCVTALLTDVVSGNHAAFAPHDAPGITVVPVHRRTKEGWLERNFVVTATLSAHSPILALFEFYDLLEASVASKPFNTCVPFTVRNIEAKLVEIANEPHIGVTLLPRLPHTATFDRPN